MGEGELEAALAKLPDDCTFVLSRGWFTDDDGSIVWRWTSSLNDMKTGRSRGVWYGNKTPLEAAEKATT